MRKNAYLDAKIGVDPAENEPRKEGCVVAVQLNQRWQFRLLIKVELSIPEEKTGIAA